MWETWQMAVVIAGGVVCVIGFLEKIQSIIHKAKQPGKDVEEKLARDYNRLNGHDKDMQDIRDILKYLIDSQNLQLENDQVILEHLRTNNSTGKISDRETAINDFLKKHQKYNTTE